MRLFRRPALLGLLLALAAPVAAQPVPLADADALAAWLRRSSPGGPTVSAHRGGHGPAQPENALESLAASLALDPRALLEVDIRLSRDSVLVLLHDETLDRTTTGSGPIGARTLADLRALALRGDDGFPTPSRLPTLAEALAWAEARAVFTLDPKRDVSPARLVRAIRAAGAENRAVVITYGADDYARYVRLAPDLTYSVSTPTVADLDAHLAVPGADARRWIAFTGTGEPDASVLARLHALDVRAMLGVFGEREAEARRSGPGVFLPLLRQNVDVLATGAVWDAVQAVRRHRR